MNRFNRALPILIFALLLSTARFSSAQPAPPESVEFTRDIVYGKGGDVELKLDLSRPKKIDHALPCILVIHGGGWSAGNKSQHDDITWNFAQRGYVAASIGYRLAPAHHFPAQVNDVKCAARFLRAHAEQYKIDPDRLGAVGFSAGAHLSMMLGVTTADDKLEGDGGWPEQSSRVQAVVAYFGPTDLAADDYPEVTRKIFETFFGGPKEQKKDEHKKASPINYLKKDSAPMLLFQGTADPLVPPTQAYKMADAMGRAGTKGRVEILPGAGHGWGGEELKRTIDATYAFFDATLRK